jgi:hypothetical protein
MVIFYPPVRAGKSGTWALSASRATPREEVADGVVSLLVWQSSSFTELPALRVP